MEKIDKMEESQGAISSLVNERNEFQARFSELQFHYEELRRVHHQILS